MGLIARATCAFHGHLWTLRSYDHQTKVVTLWCARCNPTGTGSRLGIKVVTYGA